MSRLLLDTHALIWCLADVPRLTDASRAAISDPRNQVFVSAVTAWEIGVKRARNQLKAPDRLEAVIEDRGFTHLPLTFAHAEAACRLPMLHRDPFDRFLIAQACAEGLVLVTRDRNVRRYDVAVMRA